MAYIDKINKNNTDYDLQDSKAARSVDGTTASHVEEANQLYTTSGVSQTNQSFVFRTTAGDASISTGKARLIAIEGNTTQTGHQEGEQSITVYAPVSGITASFIDVNAFEEAVAAEGFTNSQPMYITRDANENWVVENAYGQGHFEITDTDLYYTWGIEVIGTPVENDMILATAIAGSIGTLSTATPTSFVSTGYNQYNATAGYAHVKGSNQYRISGTYTSLGFTTEVGGTTTAVTVTGGKFTPSEGGYIYVNGASGDILIALVWSGIRDTDPFEAYETSTITIPTVDASNNPLPTATYGIPSVNTVRDELNFDEKKYYQRVGHYAYSVENLATVQALGVDYWYDESDIFYVLASPITYTLADSVSGEYIANDFGTEEFVGTTQAPLTDVFYADNLVDKLRNLADIQTIGSGLTLTDGELTASGGSGGGVTDLTSDDFDFPVGNPQGIALWDLDVGVYRNATDNQMTIYCAKTNSTIRTTSRPGDRFTVLWKQEYNNQIKVVAQVGVDSYNNPNLVRASSTSMGGVSNLVGFDKVVNDLNMEFSGLYVLDAAQGKILGDRNQIESSAPTSTTPGTLGGLYTDTSAMHTYQLTSIDETDPDNPVYNWTMRW